MTGEPVVVTGVGLCTPAGVGAAATWSGLLAGRSTAAPDPALAGLPVGFSCRVPSFDAAAALGRVRARRLDRAAQLAVLTAREAVAGAGLDSRTWDPTRVAVVLGVGGNSVDRYPEEFAAAALGRADRISPVAMVRSLPGAVPGEVALDLGVRGPALAVSTACASGTTALWLARTLLDSHVCDVVLAGGAESGCCPGVAVCFHQMRALARTDDPAAASRPFDARRGGFVLGEGAGVLVLERAGGAAARGARARAVLAGHGAAGDAHHHAAPHPDGRGTGDAIAAALRSARLGPGDIDCISAHATGTVAGDLAEYAGLRAVFARPPPVTAFKGTLGHAFGGSGGIAAACLVLALEHQVVPPTANWDEPDPAIPLDVVAHEPRPRPLRAVVSNSAGFGGQNAALVLTAAPDTR